MKAPSHIGLPVHLCFLIVSAMPVSRVFTREDFQTSFTIASKGSAKKRVSPTSHELNPVDCKNFLVPEGGIEPPPAQGRLDFESSASTSFTTPALALFFDYTGNLKNMSISY